MVLNKTKKRILRKRRVRAKVFGTADRPRLSVYRSNTKVTAQIINDNTGETLCYFTSKECDGKTNSDRAKALGKKMAELAKEKGISKIVFDRGGFAYMGLVKAVADSAREFGLEF